MKNRSKILSLIICIAITFSCLTYTSIYAATNPPSNPELPQDEVDRITAQLTADGSDLVNIHGEYLNAGVYKFYGVAVYGSPHEKDIGSDKKWVRDHYEYRYLGYDYNGNSITNDRFPADFPPDSAPLTDRVWQVIDDKLSSWISNAAHGDQENRILNYSLIRNDGLSYNNSLSQVVQKQAGSDIPNQKRHMLVQVAPGIISDGSVRLTRKIADGSLRYMTFILDRFNYSSPTCNINASNAVMEGDRDYVDVPVTVAGSFSSMTLPMGKTARDIINQVTLTFEGSARTVTVDNPNTTFTKRVYRQDLELGNNSITLEGLLDAGSVYRLQGDKCEYQGIRATKTINVEVKSTNAYINIEAKVVPEEKQVAGNTDENVTINVTAQLKNYNNRSNIKSWRIFSKIEGEESSLQLKILPGGSLTASTTFTFTVNKSKLSSREYTELFKVTAFADFKNKVDGNTYLNKSVYCRTHFYKNPPPEPPPPQPENLPPVAVILAPSVTVAGENVSISGRSSYDPDGTIEEYQWHIPGSIGNIQGVSGGVIYPNTGNHTITLHVADDKGASSGTSKSIRVIEPYPSAKITYYGILKENRRVTLSSAGSYSPPLYPVDSTKTTWTISPISGGTGSDIKCEGALSGVATKEVLFKKAGEYLVTLTVTNTKGLSDITQSIITIVPDLPPIANFSTVTAITRDVNDSLNATIKIADKSYSPDGDIIISRKWKYAFDSNNDGNFDDETWTNFSTENSRNVELTVNSVGKYKIELEVKEEFNGATIPSLILDSDYKRADTSLKAEDEKIAEVINLPPQVDYAMTQKNKVDLNICVGDTAHNNIDTLTSKVNNIIKPALSAAGIDLNVNILPPESKANNIFFYIGHRSWKEWDDYWEDWNTYNRYRLVAYYPDTDEHIIVVDDQPSQIKAQVLPNGKVYYKIGWGNIIEFDPATRTSNTFLASAGKVYSNFLISDDMKWIYSSKSFSYEWFGNTFKGDDFVIYNTSTGQILEKRYYNTSIVAPYQLTEGKVIINHKVWEEVFIRGHIYDPVTDTFENSVPIEPGKSIVNRNGYSYFISWFDWNRLHKVSLTTGVETTVCWNGVSNLTDGRLENVIFYNESSEEGTKFIKYLDGVGSTTLLDQEVIIYTTTFDNKVYYSKKTNAMQLYAYDIVQNSHEYIGEFPGMPQSTQYKALPGSVFYCQDSEQFSDYSISKRLSDVKWREDADSYFVHIDDKALTELDDEDISATIQDRLISNRTHFIGMGTNENQSHINNLIVQNQNKGKYISNSNLDTAFNNLKNYILEKSSVKIDVHRYITIGTEVEIDTFYSDPENDPLYRSKWRYLHDPTYFENSNGIIPDSGEDRPDPITVFEKVGKYEILYQARDNPKNDIKFDNYRLWSSDDKKLTLFVHRKPISQFNYKMYYNSSLNNYNLEITDTSYDLDHMSRADKGIVERRWQYKEVNATAWTEGMPPSTLPVDKIFMVKLEVRDMEFEWSNPYIQILETRNTSLLPVAQFVLWPNPLPIYREASITDNSYDPCGNPITSRTWTLTKSGSQLYAGVTAPIHYNLYGTGNYTLKLKVQNSKGVWSKEFSQDFRVVDDEIPPTLIIDPIERDWENTDVIVNIKSTDEGSGLKTVYYKWTNSQQKPDGIGWSSFISNNFNVTQTQNGVWYLHVESYDNRNNKIYLVGGPYKIDKISPMGFFAPNNSTWINQNLHVIFKSSDNLSGVKQWRYRLSGNNGSTYGQWNEYELENMAGILSLTSQGRWKLQAQVTDNANNATTITSGTYLIDKTPPIVGVFPASGEISVTDEVLITAYDEGGSGIKEVWYSWTDSIQIPFSGWAITSNTNLYTTPSSDGIWYLHLQAFDNAGNSSYVCQGPYIVQSLAISDVTIEGYWNHWRGQVDMFGKRMSVEPHRFLGLEKVKINVYTEGYADKVEIRFSPELEAMQFRDRYENLYDYNKDFKLNYVFFPKAIDMDNSKKENHVYWEYTLPLADSTKSWEDTVLIAPYIMEVTIWKGTKSVKHTISDIDITGNIYDLTYIQPIK